jgi:hypothetical protein
MAGIKHYYGIKLQSQYDKGELRSFYEITPHAGAVTRQRDAQIYVMVEFSEKVNSTDTDKDPRNAGRLQELVDNGWTIFDNADDAGNFLHDPDKDPKGYTPTAEELGKE